jgi:hypothetical protein
MVDGIPLQYSVPAVRANRAEFRLTSLASDACRTMLCMMHEARTLMDLVPYTVIHHSTYSSRLLEMEGSF